MSQPVPILPGGPPTELAQRCRALGLPAWRTDNQGLILAEPQEPGPGGLWLRSGLVARMISSAGAAWGGDDSPGIVEPMPGCWLIPIEERRHRERSGLTIALALSGAALDSAWFEQTSRSAQIDPAACRASLRAMARYDRVSAENARTMLRWTAHDAAQAGEDRATIAGFTRQLTDGFETIDLLYSLGRSMNDLSRPDQFVQMAIDRLHASMAFGWIAAWFGIDRRMSAVAGDRLYLAGATNLPWDDLRRTLEDSRRRLSGAPRSVILSEIAGQRLPNDGQVLVQPVLRAGRLIGVLMAGDKGGDDPQVSSYDIHLLEATGGYVGAFLDNAVLYSDQQATFLGTLKALSAAIDAKDRYTCGHSERVAMLSRRLALAWGLDDATADRLHICGLVHDVGKIGVPEAVLTKPGRLSDEEFGQIKRHPAIGHHILKDIPLLQDILPAVLHHHERWDGKGYPHGLAGPEVPLYARIVGLADTFDAMSSNRSYRPAMDRPRVLEEIRRCAGTQFDPDLVPAFMSIDLSEYDDMVLRNRDQADAAPRRAA
ncbi:MAG: HD-GYP domain-containing protein [Phycisphaeraceae bacterium]|nr:HD-GYP domain-containing protein [Phycisphaeraceae bacterium]